MKPNTPEQTVNNQAPITNQFNINGVGNPFKDLISNFENSNSDDFTDPTKDINILSDTPIDVTTLPDHTEYLSLFASRRVLFISYPGLKKLEAITEGILRQMKLAEKDRRGLFFTNEISNDTNLQFQQLIFNKVGKGNNQVIIVYITEQAFLDSTRIGKSSEVPESYIQYISNALIDKESYIICLLYESDQISHFKDKASSFPFGAWEINPLKLILSEYLNVDTAKLYADKLKAQKQTGIWGKDEIFHEIIEDTLKNKGIGGLDNLYNKAQKLIDQGIKSPEAIFEDESRLTPSSISIEGGDLVKHICFIATYFPNLSITEFRNLASTFLEDRVYKKKVEKIEKNKKGKIKRATEEEIEINCQNEWSIDADKILKKSSLIASINAHGKKVIEFNEPYLREGFYKFFEEDNSSYFFDSFNYLLNQMGIFLNLGEPRSVIESFISLFAKVISNEPNYYGQEKLLIHSLNVGNIKAEKDQPLINLIFEHLTIENFKGEAYQRIAKLILELLDYPSLKPVINNFFNELISRNPDIALRIIEHLKFTAEFDRFYWYKQLLDRGGEENHNNLIGVIIKQIQNSSKFEIYSYLRKIKEWHPNLEKNNFSISNLCGLSFITDFAISTINSLPTKMYGNWQSQYVLFSPFDDGAKADQEKIDLLIDWLFHPLLPFAFEKYRFYVKIDDLDFVKAAIIEQWYQILRSSPSPSPVAIKISKYLLASTLSKVTTRKEQKNLTHHWNKLKNIQLNKMSKVSENSKLEYSQKKMFKQIFKQRRDTLKLLLSEFKSLSKNI